MKKPSPAKYGLRVNQYGEYIADSATPEFDAFREACAKYRRFLDGKAKRNKAARARKTAKVAELVVKVKQSNRTIDYTREEWLMTAIRLLRPIFAERGYIIPDNVKATIGFPCVGARGKRIGECHCSTASKAGVFEMFISPLLDDATRVLGVLVHELIHATIGLKHKHNARFKKTMQALCLEGKPTATTEGEAFRKMVRPVLAELGPIPHKALSLSDRKKQTTRMLKVECPCCGFKYRAAKAPLLEASNVDSKGRYVQCVSPACLSPYEMAIGREVNEVRELPTRIYLDIEDEDDGSDEEE